MLTTDPARWGHASRPEFVFFKIEKKTVHLDPPPPSGRRRRLTLACPHRYYRKRHTQCNEPLGVLNHCTEQSPGQERAPSQELSRPALAVGTVCADER